MSIIGKSLATAEEFGRMADPPDGSLQELHGLCCMKTGRQLATFVEGKKLGIVLSAEANFVYDVPLDSVRGPDVAFWSFERLPDVPKMPIEIAPDLAVEVVSLSDSFGRLLRKTSEYLKRGVRLIWIADPDDRSVTVYQPGKPDAYLTENETLTGEDVLPGFSVPVSALFV